MIHKDHLNKIHCGDCNEILQKLPDNSIDLVITSPPYFQQRDYGGGGIGNEKTVEEYVYSSYMRKCCNAILYLPNKRKQGKKIR